MNAEPSRTKRRITPLLYEQESYLIREACFEVYKQFRNTQKETVYQRALEQELAVKGLQVAREKQLPVFYRNAKVGIYTPDLLVNELIIIELKAKPFLHREDISQFWYYLKNSEFRLGFLINFGEPDGVRIIRRIYDTARRRSSQRGSA
ncbi:MAG: GxxExxY protein [Candidatus Levybacteria bacterium]|nr:GxxExxY protein [Candidatus Levybacteria bacterium]